jgi:LmbE family N-acetylglucosaminyl deacetylase
VNLDLPVPGSALAIAAHPDDAEFGCGATFAKWAAEGCVLHHLVCTDGSKGSWDVSADTTVLVARRRDEQREAARRLGGTGEVRFLDVVDGELEADLTLRGRVAQIIRELRPAVLLGHDPWKRWRLHPDHRAAGFLCVDGVVAARDPHFFPEHGLAHHRPDHLLLFECEDPDHVETLEARHVEAKINALLAHESQLESTMTISQSDDGSQLQAFTGRIRRDAAEDGARAGVSLGEAYRLVTGV